MNLPVCVATMTAVLLLSPAAMAERPGDTEALSRRIERAAAQWKASCKGESRESCSVVRRVERTHACQAFSHELQMKARHGARASKAQRQLADALGDAGSEASVASEPSLSGALARARYLRAEAEYEKLVDIVPPRGLNFSSDNARRNKTSQRRFLSYLKGRQEQSTRVVDAFKAVLAMPETDATHRWRVASVARVARTYWLFADQLYGMEIPEDVRTGKFASESIAAFCDALADQAEPLEERAHEAAARCLELDADVQSAPWATECAATFAPMAP